MTIAAYVVLGLLAFGAYLVMVVVAKGMVG